MVRGVVSLKTSAGIPGASWWPLGSLVSSGVRAEIKAPRAGFFHSLAVRTEGGVVTAASQILQVIPDDQQLVVDAQLNPQDVDKVLLCALHGRHFGMRGLLEHLARRRDDFKRLDAGYIGNGLPALLLQQLGLLRALGCARANRGHDAVGAGVFEQRLKAARMR